MAGGELSTLAMANPWASSSSPMLRGGAMTLKTLVNNHLFLTEGRLDSARPGGDDLPPLAALAQSVSDREREVDALRTAASLLRARRDTAAETGPGALRARTAELARLRRALASVANGSGRLQAVLRGRLAGGDGGGRHGDGAGGGDVVLAERHAAQQEALTAALRRLGRAAADVAAAGGAGPGGAGGAAGGGDEPGSTAALERRCRGQCGAAAGSLARLCHSCLARAVLARRPAPGAQRGARAAARAMLSAAARHTGAYGDALNQLDDDRGAGGRPPPPMRGSGGGGGSALLKAATALDFDFTVETVADDWQMIDDA